MIIFDHVFFDLTMFSLLYLFVFDMHFSTAFCWSLGLCSGMKTFTQENLFFMAKPEGFNWYFPGVYSLMVPYWDILDFFYSGHISTALSFIYGLKCLSLRHPNVAFYRYATNFWIYFRLPYIWIMMTWQRTHFFIDMTAAFAMTFVGSRVAEGLAY